MGRDFGGIWHLRDQVTGSTQQMAVVVLVPLGDVAPAGKGPLKVRGSKPSLLLAWWRPPMLCGILTFPKLFPCFHFNLFRNFRKMTAERCTLCIHYVNSSSLFFLSHRINHTKNFHSYSCAFKNRLMDWNCLLSFPLSSIFLFFGWFSLPSFIQIHIPGIHPKSLCRTRVCSIICHGSYVESWLVFFASLFSCPQPTPHLRNTNPEPLRPEQTRAWLK